MSIRPAFGTEAPFKADYDSDRATRKGRAAPQALNPQGPIFLDAQWRNIWPARDQFGRGTCVAFGTIAAIELMRAREKDLPPKDCRNSLWMSK
ncbi:hypothetical protein QTO30_13225 [Yoonia sp. GPGPB17]|uniref:hypothetical protein n=1 Tax=Yoonia sp. GPGPB17 TaxID=3026147 RepID=UPI0030C628F3